MVTARLVDRLSAFRSNLAGSTSMIFGLSAVPILLLVAAGIDYSRAIQQKAQLQEATDATALAMTRLYQTDPLKVTTAQAQIFLAGAVSDANAVITSGPTIVNDSTSTSLCIQTRTSLKAAMMQVAAGMGFVPPSTMVVSGNSCTKMDQTVEVALVLDTSGSMNDTVGGVPKIKSLRDAATSLVSVLIPAGTKVPRASVSIVPFSLAVNVGSGFQGASWLDNSGKSSIALQNFRVPKGLPTKAFAPTNKFDLLSAMGQSWGGCVEERPGSYLTSDDPSTASNPDSLIVPYLNPDEDSSSNNDKLISYYGYSNVNSYIKNTSGGSCSSSTLYASADATGSKTPLLVDDGNPQLPRGDTQTMVCKYNSTSNVQSIPFYGSSSGFSTGPNLLCDSVPVTTLTNDSTLLLSQISSLVAKGSTNLISGLNWGWRTISPNGPFNNQTTAKNAIGPQNAKAYTTVSVNMSNIKYIVMVTDGMNSWNSNSSTFGNNTSTYSPFGYYENGRMGTTTASNFRSVMDNVTNQACTNAKAAGIKIFTIGFSTTADPIDADGKTLLQNCATNTNMAYFAADGSALASTFTSIAQQMSGLRLTH